MCSSSKPSSVADIEQLRSGVSLCAVVMPRWFLSLSKSVCTRASLLCRLSFNILCDSFSLWLPLDLCFGTNFLLDTKTSKSNSQLLMNSEYSFSPEDQLFPSWTLHGISSSSTLNTKCTLNIAQQNGQIAMVSTLYLLSQKKKPFGLNVLITFPLVPPSG